MGFRRWALPGPRSVDRRIFFSPWKVTTTTRVRENARRRSVVFSIKVCTFTSSPAGRRSPGNTRLREIKDDSEVAAMRRAIALTDQVMEDVIAQLRPTHTELEGAWMLSSEFHRVDQVFDGVTLHDGGGQWIAHVRTFCSLIVRPQ